MATSRGAERRPQPSDDHRTTPRNRVAETLHDRDAWHVLRGHRDKPERQGDADHGLHRQRRRGELDAGHERRRLDGRARDGHVDADHDRRGHERERHRPPRQEPRRDEPHDHHRRNLEGIDRKTRDGAEAQRKQHPCQHRLRDRRWDARDERTELRQQAGEQDERGRHEERADRRWPSAIDDAGCGEQRGARGRPRNGDGDARGQREDDRRKPHRDAHGKEAARGLLWSRAHRIQPSEHHDKCACESNERGDDARGDGAGDGFAGSGGVRRCHRAGSTGSAGKPSRLTAFFSAR